MEESAKYVLGQSERAAHRLAIQDEQFAEVSERLLDELDLKPAMARRRTRVRARRLQQAHPSPPRTKRDPGSGRLERRLAGAGNVGSLDYCCRAIPTRLREYC